MAKRAAIPGNAPRAARTASKLLKVMFDHMDAHGITQAWLAEAIGMHRNRMVEYRKGSVTPSVMVVEEMAEVLGFSIEIRR